jgi:hypothetical protein
MVSDASVDGPYVRILTYAPGLGAQKNEHRNPGRDILPFPCRSSVWPKCCLACALPYSLFAHMVWFLTSHSVWGLFSLFLRLVPLNPYNSHHCILPSKLLLISYEPIILHIVLIHGTLP